MLACYFCGEEHATRVWCPEGHFVCRPCCHKPVYDYIVDVVQTSRSKNPFEIASLMMVYPSLEEHSCEHAWVFTTALLIAVKNEGSIALPQEAILGALDAIKEQADPRLVHSTGVCRISSVVAVAFHAIYRAAYSEMLQDDMTMKVVAQAIEHLADETSRCRCCKRVVLTTMDLVVALVRARFGIEVEGSSEDVICRNFGDYGYCDPYGCQFSMLLKG